MVELRARAAFLLAFVGSIWAVSLLGFVFPLRTMFGIEPRELTGLLGIVTSPWIHANLEHLVSNTVPLVILGWLVIAPSEDDFLAAIVGSAVAAGSTAWLLGGPNTVHLGASGLVYGLFGFVVARGYYARRSVDLMGALLAVVVYGASILLGVLPAHASISWQSHVGGLIGGALTARALFRKHRALSST